MYFCLFRRCCFYIFTGMNYKMVAKTFFGFEDLLVEELETLGAQNVEKGNRMVSFYGDKGFMYKANLCLRTALKILKPIEGKRVQTPESLYKFAQSIDWNEYLEVKDTFAVYATVSSDLFNHSKYVALKVKDAIVDQFRDKTGERPSVDTERPDLIISVHIGGDMCTISLDSSGASLHHRGYRSATNIAPINEVLAAGLIMLSGWNKHTDFLDPMCGSGTLLIEAAMIANNIPCNINRKEFAFEKWLDWDMDLYERIEDSVLKKVTESPAKLWGYDKAPSAVRKAKDNIKNANMEEFISIQEENFFYTEKQDSEKALHMVFNPPYGERIAINMPEFYGEIGDTLKKSYPATDAWFITSDLEAIKHVGLRPSRKIKLFNGKLESRLLQYKMYSGSKRTKFNKN